MTKRKALFIINGFGLGNATRCEGVMDLLASKYQIDVITSDKAFEFFSGNEKVSNLYRQKDINLKSRFAYGTILFFLTYLIYFSSRVWRNFRIQARTIVKNKYDIVFVDSDYSFIFHRLAGRRNFVGINNAYEVITFFKNSKSIKPKLWLSFLIEVMDFAVCRSFLNFIVCPAISYQKLVKQSHPNKVLVCAPFIRERLLKGEIKSSDGLLVVGTSSGERSALTAVSRWSTVQKALINDFEKDNVGLLQNAGTVFCNAGQSSIAECLYLKKRAVLFPIPRHSEQFANAILAKDLGLMIYGGQEESHLLKEISEHFSAQGTMAPWDYSLTRKMFFNHFGSIEKEFERLRK